MGRTKGSLNKPKNTAPPVEAPAPTGLSPDWNAGGLFDSDLPEVPDLDPAEEDLDPAQVLKDYIKPVSVQDPAPVPSFDAPASTATAPKPTGGVLGPSVSMTTTGHDPSYAMLKEVLSKLDLVQTADYKTELGKTVQITRHGLEDHGKVLQSILVKIEELGSQHAEALRTIYQQHESFKVRLDAIQTRLEAVPADSSVRARPAVQSAPAPQAEPEAPPPFSARHLAQCRKIVECTQPAQRGNPYGLDAVANILIERLTKAGETIDRTEMEHILRALNGDLVTITGNSIVIN